MQVLTERITALITVIQSFPFFPPPPHPNTTLVLSLFLVNFQMPFTKVLPTCFAHGAQGICDPSEGDKKKKRKEAARGFEVRIVKERKAQ